MVTLPSHGEAAQTNELQVFVRMVIETSWEAMVSARHLQLMRLLGTDSSTDKVVADYCWTA